MKTLGTSFDLKKKNSILIVIRNLIKIDDEYVYFCTECEVERYGCPQGCKHWDHPRVPIGFDIGQHLEKTGNWSGGFFFWTANL